MVRRTEVDDLITQRSNTTSNLHDRHPALAIPRSGLQPPPASIARRLGNNAANPSDQSSPQCFASELMFRPVLADWRAVTLPNQENRDFYPVFPAA
jgi:hypothetical protein